MNSIPVLKAERLPTNYTNKHELGGGLFHSCHSCDSWGNPNSENGLIRLAAAPPGWLSIRTSVFGLLSACGLRVSGWEWPGPTLEQPCPGGNPLVFRSGAALTNTATGGEDRPATGSRGRYPGKNSSTPPDTRTHANGAELNNDPGFADRVKARSGASAGPYSRCLVCLACLAGKRRFPGYAAWRFEAASCRRARAAGGQNSKRRSAVLTKERNARERR